MPDRPKPHRRKNKAKSISSNNQFSKYSSRTKNASSDRNVAPASSSAEKVICTINYTSDHSTASNTSEGSSQELVHEEEKVVPIYHSEKRPSFNRSFSECYEKPSSVRNEPIRVVVTPHSDNEDGAGLSNIVTDNLKKIESDGLRGSTGSIDSQKSCDSGFADAKSSLEDEGVKLMPDSALYALEGSTSMSQKGIQTKELSTIGCESDVSSMRRLPTIASANAGVLCNFCLERPKNACFVHQKISHQLCCYQCAKKIYRQTGHCPVCRRKIEKITKNVMV